MFCCGGQASGRSSAATLRHVLRDGARDAARRVLAVAPYTLLLMVPSQGLYWLTYETASAAAVSSSRLASEMFAGGCAGVVEWSTALPGACRR